MALGSTPLKSAQSQVDEFRDQVDSVAVASQVTVPRLFSLRRPITTFSPLGFACLAQESEAQRAEAEQRAQEAASHRVKSCPYKDAFAGERPLMVPVF